MSYSYGSWVIGYGSQLRLMGYRVWVTTYSTDSLEQDMVIAECGPMVMAECGPRGWGEGSVSGLDTCC